MMGDIYNYDYSASSSSEFDRAEFNRKIDFEF